MERQKYVSIISKLKELKKEVEEEGCQMPLPDDKKVEVLKSIESVTEYAQANLEMIDTMEADNEG